MKNMIIIVLVCSGFAMAQHLDVVNQKGNLNNSVVEQKFYENSFVNNAPEIAYVDQIGNNNGSFVYQIKTNIDPLSGLADIYQKGNFNNSDVKQNNFSHTAYVTQFGKYNESDVDQYQGVTNAVVSQNGIKNYGKIEMHGVSSSAIINQTGVENETQQFMGSLNKGALLSSFTSFQAGSLNDVTQEMDGYSPALNNNNVGCVSQIGINNLTQQKMFNEGPNLSTRAHDNFATSMTIGSNNESYQFMKRYDNSSEVTQFGNNNLSISHQNW